MSIGFKGVVLDEIDKGEKGKVLVALTADKGLVYIYAPGAHKVSSSNLKSTQKFSCSRFYVSARNGKYVLQEADLFDDFIGLRDDYAGYCLASYTAEVAMSVAVDVSDCNGILSLTLNTFYAIAHRLFPVGHIKCVFELKLAMLLGFEPDIETCPFCEAENKTDPLIFDLENGYVCCADCLPEDADQSVCYPITAGAVRAIQYIASAPPAKAFSFHVDEKSFIALCRAAENYLLLRSETTYKSLEVLKSALKAGNKE